MSCFWDRLKETGLINQLHQNYTQPFPIEVRALQKEWIEQNFIQKNWNLEPANVADYSAIVELVRCLCINTEYTKEQLENVIPNLNEEDSTNSLRTVDILKESVGILQASFPNQVVEVYKHIHNCLSLELNLLNHGQIPKDQKPVPVFHPAVTQINIAGMIAPSIDDPSIRDAKVDRDLLKSQEQDLMKALDSMTNKSSLLTTEMVQKYASRMNYVHTKLNELQGKLLHEILRWQTSLARTRTKDALDEIQGLFQDLILINRNCRSQLNQFMPYTQKQCMATYTDMVDINHKFLIMHLNLIKNSLIMEEPLSQILRVATNFKAKVRCLLEKSSTSSSNVKSFLVNHSEMMKLLERSDKCVMMQHTKTYINCGGPPSAAAYSSTQGKKKKSKTRKVFKKLIPARRENASTVKLVAYDSLDQPTEFNIEPADPDWLKLNEVNWSARGPNSVASFERAKFAESGGPREKEGDSVLYKKYYMIFHTEVTETLNGRPLKLWVWTYSHNSNRITTNKVQDVQAMGDLVWCDAHELNEAFCHFKDESPLEAIPWTRVGRALNKWFFGMTNTVLNTGHLQVLRTKLFNGSGPADDSSLVRRAKFQRDLLPKTQPGFPKFTFWQWFYEIGEVTATYLVGDQKISGPWQDGKIIGFISRDDIMNKLNQPGVENGAFLLKFSDSVLGGISIGFLKREDVEEPVQFYGPLQSDKLKLVNGLVNHIIKFEDIKCLYPECTPKKDAFAKYIVPEKAKVPGYVKVYDKILSKCSSKSKENASAAAMPQVPRVTTSPSPDSCIRHPNPQPWAQSPMSIFQEDSTQQYVNLNNPTAMQSMLWPEPAAPSRSFSMFETETLSPQHGNNLVQAVSPASSYSPRSDTTGSPNVYNTNDSQGWSNMENADPATRPSVDEEFELMMEYLQSDGFMLSGDAEGASGPLSESCQASDTMQVSGAMYQTYAVLQPDQFQAEHTFLLSN